MTTPAAPPQGWRGRWVVLAGIVLVALNLRIAVAAVSPILDTVRADVDLSPAEAGVLGTIPVASFALFVGLIPLTARGYQAVSQSTAVDVTAEITAIDYDDRVVVLEDEGGNVEWVYAQPEIKRFNELKVGDKVTFRYYESVLSQITKASDQAPSPAASEPTTSIAAKPLPKVADSTSATSTLTLRSSRCWHAFTQSGLVDVRRTRRGATTRRPPPAWSMSR